MSQMLQPSSCNENIYSPGQILVVTAFDGLVMWVKFDENEPLVRSVRLERDKPLIVIGSHHILDDFVACWKVLTEFGVRFVNTNSLKSRTKQL